MMVEKEQAIEWTPGIHYGWSFDQYRAIDAINVSTLKWAGISPAHLKAALDGLLAEAKTESRSMIFGRAMHAILLEPELFDEKFVVSGPCEARLKSGTRKGEACSAPGVCLSEGEWFCGKHARPEEVEEFKAGPATVITEDEAARLRTAAEIVKRHPAVKLLRQRGGYEATVCFELEGVKCKGRLDKDIPRKGDQPPIIVDLKTVRVGYATDEAVSRAIWEYQYDVQAAWYSDAVALLRGEPPLFVWVFIETDYPFGVRVLQCDTRTIQVGRMRYREYLGEYLRGMSTGSWPAYGDDQPVIETGGLPEWAIAKYLPNVGG